MNLDAFMEGMSPPSYHGFITSIWVISISVHSISVEVKLLKRAMEKRYTVAGFPPAFLRPTRAAFSRKNAVSPKKSITFPLLSYESKVQ